MGIRLSELGIRPRKKPVRHGAVVSVSRSGNQCRIKWDDVATPQLIHRDLIDHAPADMTSAPDEPSRKGYRTLSISPSPPPTPDDAQAAKRQP
jgi:hypothetical protein